ncbi:hypothetical protein I9W82_000656 [Candida metapsilosis]|uniref:Retrotransposon gag domain-containing protein n=1 Tax=Candida metapsilosis TaxID=273372 RepID=A0A8H8DE01_9ASCO|nr:hypothetical protein I9W82_000656 [Candida metapsilosis]
MPPKQSYRKRQKVTKRPPGPVEPMKKSQWIENQDSNDYRVKHAYIFSGLDDQLHIEFVITQINFRLFARSQTKEKLMLWDLEDIVSTHLVGGALMWFQDYIKEQGNTTIETRMINAFDNSNSTASTADASETFKYEAFLKAFRDKFKKPEHLPMLQTKLSTIKQMDQSYRFFKKRFDETLNLFTVEERKASESFIVGVFKTAVNKDYRVAASLIKTLDDINDLKEIPDERIKRYKYNMVMEQRKRFEGVQDTKKFCKNHPNSVSHTTAECKMGAQVGSKDKSRPGFGKGKPFVKKPTATDSSQSKN